METIRDINHLIPTADAEDITFQHDGADLHLNFKDWKEKTHEVIFPDAVFVAWGAEVDERFRYDSAHEVLNSERIQNLPDNATGRHHYVLCFNAASNLEVVSNELRTTTTNN